MLLQRYGRHGPETWRVRRQRRFQRHLPALVSTRVSVRVPVSTERILFIVLNASDDFERHEPLPFPGDTHALQPIIDISSIANAARMQGVDDIEDMKVLAERSVRSLVMTRKISGGSRSPKAVTHAWDWRASLAPGWLRASIRSTRASLFSRPA